jgi:Tau95 Triple barrel domain
LTRSGGDSQLDQLAVMDTNRGPGGLGAKPKAPSFKVAESKVEAVEHPCIIKNLDRGMQSLGGDKAVEMVCSTTLGLGRR